MFKNLSSQAALALALATAPVAVLAAPWATEPAQAASQAGRSSYDGVVEALRQTVVAAQVPGAVVELAVKAGDTVKAEQSLITVESDKASMEIPSSHAGVVKELRVQVGDKVKQGSVVLVLDAAGAAAQASEQKAAAAPAEQAPAAIKTEAPAVVVAAPAAAVPPAPAAAAPPPSRWRSPPRSPRRSPSLPGISAGVGR